MKYKYYTLDVFTDRPFSGNQLAVFPTAEGLSAEVMTKIAIEFNFSETVFVFPPENATMNYRLRIFTPGGEIPFAGHPTIGTAYLLASLGMVDLPNNQTEIMLGENVGNVPVMIESANQKPLQTTLKAPNPADFFSILPPLEDIAQVLSLSVADLHLDYAPQAVSCGLPFLIVPLNNIAALSKAKIDLPEWEKTLREFIAPHVYPCYQLDEFHWQVRMFAPALNIVEDPATGSAATAFAAYLASHQKSSDGLFQWSINQGIEIDRPSKIIAIATKKDHTIQEILVRGESVIVTEGFFYL